MSYNTTHSIAAPIDNIVGIQFSILSPEEIKKTSVAEIYTQETYDGDVPKVGGLFDKRMGVIDYGKLCLTDEKNCSNCPGHFGHIELAVPVFHVHFLSYVLKTMRCICFNCSKLLISRELIKDEVEHLTGLQRFTKVYQLCSKVKRCGDKNSGEDCGSIQPDRYTKEAFKIYGIWKKLKVDNKRLFSAKDIHTILLRISTEDANTMGFSPTWCMPAWLICTVLPVAPPHVRPSVRQDNNQRMEDDLTHKYCDIIKTNRTLKSKIQTLANQQIIDEWTHLLQYHIATLVDNQIPGIPQATQRSGRPLKSIRERLKTKEGRVRGNLMGKRVDFSARSVITPDPNLGLNELGVPLKIAMNMSYPEVVTRYNIKEMTSIIRNGPDIHPGARHYYQSSTNRTLSLAHIDRDSVILNYGDIIHRHLKDGDFVLFNRQPSLHKMSMMCHTIRVMPYKTFRLNVNVTSPYNADFDGDEMNMHVPQSIQAKTELEMLASVSTQIVGPRESKPVIGLVQDTLLGVNRLTKYDVYLTEQKAKELLVWVDSYDGVLPKADISEDDFDKSKPNIFNTKSSNLWSGKQIMSKIIPDINIVKKNNSYDDIESAKHKIENKIVIENGYMKNGILDKSLMGSGSGGIIHIIFNDLGHNATRIFLNDVQSIVTNWILQTGFSVGISDLIANKITKKKNVDFIKEKKNKVAEIIQYLHRGIFENNSGKSNYNEFELQVNTLLNKAVNDSGKRAISQLEGSNRMINMVKAGSKGSIINIGQMIGCVGQQNIDGKRIAYGFTDRTMPHFYKYDDGPESRGFVEHSFMDGLTPQEFFFHAMSGREGLIDTAVKTSETGYIQRRMIKALEDVKISTDFTVRDAQNTIVQFVYGDDGMDGAKVEKQRIPTLMSDYKSLSKEHQFLKKENWTTFCSKSVVGEVSKSEDLFKRLEEHFNIILKERKLIVEDIYGYTSNDTVYLPINFNRLIHSCLNKFHIEKHHKSDIHPLYILDKIDELIEEVTRMVNNNDNLMMNAMIRIYLSPKSLIKKYRMNIRSFDYLCNTIIDKFAQSIINYGEMVGTIAAQSIGEPATQMTLNSVEYNTYILLKINNTLHKFKMGEFIDNYIEKLEKDKLEFHPNDTTLGWCKEDDIQILSADEEGNVTWKKIEAVTKHLPINKDGTSTLLQVKTSGGREVIATKAKSFLTLKDNKLVPTEGSDLNVGDYLPVHKKGFSVAREDVIDVLDVSTVLSKREYNFGSEIQKGLSVCHETYWWKKYHGTYFTTPYSRSDIFRCATSSKLRKGCTTTQTYVDGVVYPKHSVKVQACIPENIPLDYNFGFLVGAYLAEGCVTNTQISISNNEEVFYEPIQEFCNKYSITTKRYTQNDKNKVDWTSKDIRIYSVVLTRLFTKMLGKGSANKKIPAIFLQAPKEFQIGLLNAYISGDGCVTDKRRAYNIVVSSVSRELLEDIQCLLLQVNDIYSKISTRPQKLRKFKTVQPFIYCLSIRNHNVQRFASVIKLIIKKKQDRLEESMTYNYRFKFGQYDIIPEYIVNDKKYINIHREKLEKITKTPVFDDLVFERIDEILPFESTHKYVYDFTVKETKNFNICNQIILHDTFHFAGVSSKSSIIRGVPRLKEILSVSKNIKAPVSSVYLTEEHRYDKIKAKEILDSIELTKIKDIVVSTSIYFDPLGGDLSTDIDDDIELLKLYHEFLEIDPMLIPPVESISPWVLRLEFSRDKIMNKNISMIDVYHAITKHFEKTDICCLFSDDSAGNLIFRIQICNSVDCKDEEEDCISAIQILEKTILNNIILKGVEGINQTSMYKDNNHVMLKNNNYESKAQWVINTVGSNLLELMNHPDIDFTQTICNDIQEIYELLGIEAAREALVNELTDVITDGGFVNYRHIALLSDTVCHRGYLMSVDRHGINKSSTRGPISKATFEETTDILFKSALFGVYDDMKGVSSNIMMGQEVPIGTGSIDIMLDEEILLKHLKQQTVVEEEFKYEEVTIDEYCTEANFDFSINTGLLLDSLTD